MNKPNDLSLRYYNHVSHSELVRMTRAVLKFFEDHDGVPFAKSLLSEILESLNVDDFPRAFRLFTENPPGPNCWGDWFPPAVFENENEEYVWMVFESLLERWHRLMSAAGAKKRWWEW